MPVAQATKVGNPMVDLLLACQNNGLASEIKVSFQDMADGSNPALEVRNSLRLFDRCLER
jgi:hypothetical protein